MSDDISFLNNTVGGSLVALSARSHTIISMIQAMRMVSALRIVNDNVLANFVCKTFEQSGNRIEYFVKVHAQYFVGGNIGHVLIKTAMYVNIMVDHETRMSESLNVAQLVPV